MNSVSITHLVLIQLKHLFKIKEGIDQFRYITELQPKTIDLSTKLLGIATE